MYGRGCHYTACTLVFATDLLGHCATFPNMRQTLVVPQAFDGFFENGGYVPEGDA